MNDKVRKWIIIGVSVFVFLFILFDIKVATYVECDSLIELEYGDKLPTIEVDSFIESRLFDKKYMKLNTIIESNVDETKLGEYDIKYSSSFLFYKDSNVVHVSVKDTLSPTIVLTKDINDYTLPGHEYVETGYQAFDIHDGDLTDKVVRVDENGIVTYTVIDSSGNKSTIQREIIYDDPEPPVIELKGDDIVELSLNEEYVDAGFTATDNADGDISHKVSVILNVDTSTEGVGDVTYYVRDSWGNETVVKRMVNVTDNKVLTESMFDLPEHKRIYLTFDDGPGPDTERLLDILDKYNVKATFFVTNQYPEYQDMIKEEVERGHSIALHSYSHDYASIYCSEEAYFEDLQKIQDIVIDKSGVMTQLIRFPGGSSNTVSKSYCEGIMSKLVVSVEEKGYYYFDWNVTSGDAGDTTDTDEIIQNVITGCENNDISVVLQHDSQSFSVDAVERIIQWGLENGYTFLPLRIDSPVIHHPVNN